jgi:hypothetical protein
MQSYDEIDRKFSWYTYADKRLAIVLLSGWQFFLADFDLHAANDNIWKQI